MKYTYKERVRMARKLKIFLAVFFAALTFFTGKVILDKTLAEDNDTYEFPVIPANTNPNWYQDFSYDLDTSLHTITLREYIGGTVTNYSIPATATINNVTYNTIVYRKDSFTSAFAEANIQNLTFEAGVRLHNYCNYMFNMTNYLQTINFSNIDMSNVVDMTSMFDFSTKLIAVNFGNFDASNVTSMNSLFDLCWALRYVDLSNFNTVNVTNMSSMFKDCNKLESIDLSNFNTGNVTNMRNMFTDCKMLTTLDLSNFNTSNVTDMYEMFSGCTRLTTLNLSSFNTSNVTTMYRMFYNCYQLKELNLSGFNTPNLSNMDRMFYECYSLTKLDLSAFNTSNITDMQYLFYHCSKVLELDISNFDTSNVTNMNYMLTGDSKLGILKLGQNFNFLSGTGLSGTWKRDGDNTVYTASELETNYSGSTMAGTYRSQKAYAFLYENGNLVFTRGVDINESYGEVLASYTDFEENANRPWDSNHNIKKVIFKDQINPNSGYRWFYSLVQLEEIINIDKLNTSNMTEMRQMFYHCDSLTSLDLSSFDTSQVIEMNSMFYHCTSLESVNLSSFNTQNTTDMSSMFGECSSLIQLNLNNFSITSETNTASMFYKCSPNALILGTNFTFNGYELLGDAWENSQTGNVYTGLELMNTYNGATMAGTYTKVNCYAVVYASGEMVFQPGNTPDPAKGNTLGIYPLPNNVNSYSDIPWYVNRESITTVTFTYEIAPKTTTYWFYGMKNLTNIKDMQYYLDTSNVDNMSYMFDGCEKIEELDLRHFWTNNVTTLKNMFANCKKLVRIYFPHTVKFEAGNSKENNNYATLLSNINNDVITGSFSLWYLTDISYMFYNCESLVSLNLSLTDSGSSGFEPTAYNKKIDFISNITAKYNEVYLDTGNVISMEKMFSGCTSLKYLDISGFNCYTLETMYSMFENTTSLERLSLGRGFFFLPNSKLQNFWVRLGDSTIYAAEELTSTYDGTTMAGVYRRYDSLRYALLYSNGELVFQIGDAPDPTKGEVVAIYDGFENDIYQNVGSPDVIGNAPWYQHHEDITTVTFLDEVAPASTAYWFCELENLETINNLDYLNTSYVTNMTAMFSGCSSLEYLDVATFDTTNVENMAYMFNSCTNLEFLDLSNFNTFNVKYMNSMFAWCGRLQVIDVSSFDVNGVRDMDSMFTYCDQLRYLDISNFSNTNIQSMNNMFDGMHLLRVIKIGENFEKASPSTNAGLTGTWKKDGDNTYTFEGDNIIGSGAGIYRRVDDNYLAYALLYDTGELVFQIGDIPDPSIGNVVETYTNFEDQNFTNYDEIPWYSERASVTKVTFDEEIIPISTVGWFYGMNNLTDINLYYLNTSEVTNMSEMFRGCTHLTDLDVSFFDTSKVEDMSYMFYDCWSLTNLDLSNFDTWKVNNMKSIFAGCSSALTIDISSFDTSSVTNMSGMFINCAKVVSLDVSTFDTSKVTDMSGMFAKCNSLIDLDVSNFDTSKVTKFSGNNIYRNSGFEYGMFHDCGNLTQLNISSFDTKNATDMALMFCGCKSLPNINISHFNTSNVTNMKGMFAHCNELTSIDISSFDTSNVTNMGGMFAWCTKLSSIDVSNFDTSNVIYFSGRIETNNAINLQGMFSGCQNITTLDLSNFDTGVAIDMSEMFSDCTKLSNLNIESFNTENVTKMNMMFSYCKSLKNLDLNHFDTSKVTDMSYMFYICEKLETLEIDNFNTENVTYMHHMFAGCGQLNELDVSNFDTSNVTDMGQMFTSCEKLKELDISNFNTSSVTDMDNMLYNMPKLNTLKLGQDFNFLSNNGLTKYWVRDGDTTRYTAEELTNSYSGATMAGTYRALSKLTISEEVRGSLADVNKNFNFTITVMDGSYGLDGTYSYTGSKSGTLYFDDGVATFTLKHGQTIDTYLPSGYYIYTITQNSDGYTLAKSGDTNNLDYDRVATFTDTLNGTTPTGIYLDIVPYILMIVFGIGSILLLRKKFI